MHDSRIATDGGVAWGDGSGSFDVRLSRHAANVLALDAGDGLQFAEGTADLAAPAERWARLYTRDNGSGKTPARGPVQYWASDRHRDAAVAGWFLVG